MHNKKLQYASSLGISFFELDNDPRLTYTMHVWFHSFIMKKYRSFIYGWRTAYSDAQPSCE